MPRNNIWLVTHFPLTPKLLKWTRLGLPDFQSRNTGDFWTRKRVPVAKNVVLVVVLVLLLGVLISIDFPVPKALSFLNRS